VDEPMMSGWSATLPFQNPVLFSLSMTATHHLDVSLTLDDIGWHFLNFGEPNFVREREAGLRDLGLEALTRVALVTL
jgi:hypothetical protein